MIAVAGTRQGQGWVPKTHRQLVYKTCLWPAPDRAGVPEPHRMLVDKSRLWLAPGKKGVPENAQLGHSNICHSNILVTPTLQQLRTTHIHPLCASLQSAPSSCSPMPPTQSSTRLRLSHSLSKWANRPLSQSQNCPVFTLDSHTLRSSSFLISIFFLVTS